MYRIFKPATYTRADGQKTGICMKKTLFLIILTFLMLPSVTSWGQTFYWVGFTDKNDSPWLLSNPREFLSERALHRREKQNIPIDSLDLPVNPSYIKKVVQLEATHVQSSKWLNGITVKTSNNNFEEQALALPFVKEVQLTKKSTEQKSLVNKFAEPEAPDQSLTIDTTVYGASVHQVGQLNGQFLHNSDFRGQGVHIAVLDAGFYRADQFQAFDSLWAGGQILGEKDFVNSDDNIYEGHYHGMSVLSIMGGNVPGQLIGTAPGASYWLLRTEDIYSEYLIEEDNWVAGAEFADSVGVDIINSSLGYYTFDDPQMNHTYADMDGNTTRVTRAANIAASRGMLVFSSAGNEGNDENEWKYIIAPSDGDSVVGVGAVNSLGSPAHFTSYGPASDGDVKPNVVAVGWNTVVQRRGGLIGTGNGTSYSSPVLAGMAACLWQENPFSTASQVKKAIEKSAHLYNNPDSLLGYGIPDMKIASQILKSSMLEQWDNKKNWLAYPNPADDYIILQKHTNIVADKVEISFYSMDGRLLRKEVKPDAPKIMIRGLQSFKQGILLLQIISGDVAETIKIKK